MYTHFRIIANLEAQILLFQDSIDNAEENSAERLQAYAAMLQAYAAMLQAYAALQSCPSPEPMGEPDYEPEYEEFSVPVPGDPDYEHLETFDQSF